MKEPIWVRQDVVLAIHRRQLAEHGGGDGIRDRGLLMSCVDGSLFARINSGDFDLS